MATEAPARGVASKVRLRDHARVAWLLVKTIFAIVPYLILVPLSPILGPYLRAGVRRRLAAAGDPELLDPTQVAAGIDLAALSGKRIFVVAGEASGDRMAARVVREMRARQPDIDIVGYAGPACAEAGMRVDKDLTAHAVMGVFAVIATLAFWWRICAQTLARFRDDPPDLLLTVDFPGLNVRLLQWAHGAGIRTVHLVAPQVWAHAPWRIRRWRHAVDHMLSTMPFEKHLFDRSRIRTTYVGHPLFEAPLSPPRSPERRPSADFCVELWPGSRTRELKHHVPILAAAAQQLRAALPELRLVVPLAHERHRERFASLWTAATPEARLPDVVVGAPSGARGSTDAPGPIGALVTSGTATAQVAVDLVPQVVFYRVRLPTRVLAYFGLTTPWFCLANLVAGREVAPEHLVGGPRAASRLTRDLLAQIGTPEAYAERRRELDIVRARLSAPDVAARAAVLVLAELV